VTPRDSARAREAGYRLLARLVSGPITADLLAAAAIDPRLVTEQPLDELAAAHLAAFDHGAFPHAGVFLDAEPGIGGDAATACADLWRRIGLAEERWRDRPGHLASHLEALAWLSGAEADALSDAAGEQAERMRGLQAEVLDRLLLWLPQWRVAVRGGWCGAVAGVCGELVVHHRLDLVGRGVPLSAPSEQTDPGLALDDPSTGIRDIAAFLTAPARCGVLLTAEHITAIGRELDTPGGFGPRRQRLGNLLRSAARFDRWSGLIESLDAAVLDAATALMDSPWAELDGVAHQGLHRLGQTRQALQTLGSRQL
jgi:hypothetical protein